MTRPALRRALAAVALVFLASSCIFGGGDDPAGAAQDIAQQGADDVSPPDVTDDKRTALVGLVIQTTSPSLVRLLDAPTGKGVVVLFIQPQGPADKKGIARGDLLTKVDGVTVTNHEHALSLMRSRPGEKRKLTFVRRRGTEREIEIEAREPRGQSVASYVTPQIDGNPNDAVLRYLRAQDGRAENSLRLNDLEKALEIDPKFVEAIILRASLVWDVLRPRAKDDKTMTQLANQAIAGWSQAIDLDPRNTIALSLRSTSLTTLGKGAEGRADAERARRIDDTYPRAFWSLAQAQRKLKKLDEAVGPARAATELNPFSPTYFLTLAQLYMELKRPEDCEKTADAIIPFLESQQLENNVEVFNNTCSDAGGD